MPQVYDSLMSEFYCGSAQEHWIPTHSVTEEELSGEFDLRRPQPHWIFQKPPTDYPWMQWTTQWPLANNTESTFQADPESTFHSSCLVSGSPLSSVLPNPTVAT